MAIHGPDARGRREAMRRALAAHGLSPKSNLQQTTVVCRGTFDASMAEMLAAKFGGYCEMVREDHLARPVPTTRTVTVRVEECKVSGPWEHPAPAWTGA